MHIDDQIRGSRSSISSVSLVRRRLGIVEPEFYRLIAAAAEGDVVG